MSHKVDVRFTALFRDRGAAEEVHLRRADEARDKQVDRVVVEVLRGIHLPKDRDIAMVFQNYALYPHMSVYDNMAFGLKLRTRSRRKYQS